MGTLPIDTLASATGRTLNAFRWLASAYRGLLAEKEPTTCEHEPNGLCYDCDNKARADRWV